MWSCVHVSLSMKPCYNSLTNLYRESLCSFIDYLGSVIIVWLNQVFVINNGNNEIAIQPRVAQNEGRPHSTGFFCHLSLSCDLQWVQPWSFLKHHSYTFPCIMWVEKQRTIWKLKRAICISRHMHNPSEILS